MDTFENAGITPESQNDLPNPKKKWVAIFILSLFLLTVISGIVLYFLSNRSKYPEIPEETGAALENTPPAAEIAPLDQFYALMDKTPILHEKFVLESDYKENKLVVTLSSPTTESKQIFLDWLNSGGYDQVPEEKIVYQEAKK